MADETWRQIREIFDEALSRGPEERGHFIREACGGDESMRAEVESLLASLDGAESFLETPAIAHVADSIEPETVKLKRGQRFGHYEIIEPIGAGGMGEVYLARDKKLDRKVAVKILNERFSRHESNLKRFVSEAKAASALNHPNILVIHEIGSDADTHYIVSEFVKGKTLRETLKRSPMKLTEILDVALQVAGALSSAHEARLVHRDIKPENVMIRPDGFVKVLDFGLAKLVGRKNRSVLGLEESTIEDHQTAKGVILGTVNYMSPEQAKGEHVDERTDIFSLGVLIYEMIAQKTPFAGGSVSETFANLINQEPPPLTRFAANVPAEVQRIVTKMLRKKADERYQTMRDVYTDLKDLREDLAAEAKLDRSASANGNATAVMPATTGGRTRHSTAAATLGAFSQSIKRNKPLTAFLSMGLLAGVLALSYSFFPFTGPEAPSGKRSIAILPVRSINSGSRDELYEVGIAYSLIHHIGTLNGLVVRPMKAVHKYLETEHDPIAAGREQRVDYVLDSNYQIADGRIRVTAQLLDVATGEIEDAFKSEKEVGSIFAMQDAIASEIRGLLQSRLAIASGGPAVDRGTANEQAYRLYLQGRFMVEKEDVAGARRALEIFEEALRLDPNFANAWASKARAHCLYAHVGGDSPHAQFALAKPALDRAFALDSDLPEAHVVLGIIENDYHWNFAEAEKRFRRAIELAPNSDIYYRWLATRLAGQGRFDEAITLAKTAIDINPNYVNHQMQYGRVLYAARRFDEAIAQMQRVTEMDTSLPLPYSVIWQSYHAKGDGQRAYDALMNLLRMRGMKADVLKSYQARYAESGWQGVLSKNLEDVKAGNANNSAAYLIAVLSAHLGQGEQAFRYLDAAVDGRSMEIPYINGDPAFDPLRGDPRFADLLKRIQRQ